MIDNFIKNLAEYIALSVIDKIEGDINVISIKKIFSKKIIIYLSGGKETIAINKINLMGIKKIAELVNVIIAEIYKMLRYNKDKVLNALYIYKCQNDFNFSFKDFVQIEILQ